MKETTPYMIRLRKNLGRQLQELREARYMTLEEAAEVSGLQVGNIAKVEKSRYNFPIDVVARLCEVYRADLKIEF